MESRQRPFWQVVVFQELSIYKWRASRFPLIGLRLCDEHDLSAADDAALALVGLVQRMDHFPTHAMGVWFTLFFLLELM